MWNVQHESRNRSLLAFPIQHKTQKTPQRYDQGNKSLGNGQMVRCARDLVQGPWPMIKGRWFDCGVAERTERPVKSLTMVRCVTDSTVP